MSLRKELIQAGQAIGEAIAVGGSTELGVTVTTSTNTSQATGYAITKSNTIVTTSGATPAAGQNALTLPTTLEQGDWMQVANFTANVIYIWPGAGWGIHGLGQNASYSLAAGKTANFTVVTNPDAPFPQGAGGAFTFNQLLAIQG